MVKAEHADISKIAIIGTEGAGKTVFVTVWSKLLEKQEEGRPFIIPDPSTYAYIEKNWSKLRNGQWPESTPQSEFVNLFWRLKMPSGHLCQINVCDVAGHDIRRLFTGNKPQASDDPTKAIYGTVAAANIVLVIINLKDFITTSESQRIDNCASLLSLLQYMFEQKKKVALIFSQWHEYETWVVEHGSVEAVLCTYMPAVYNTCCLEDENDYFKVAAVVETTSRVEGGITVANPAPNFTSSGFSGLNDWIMAVVGRKPTVRPFLSTDMKSLLIIGGWCGAAFSQLCAIGAMDWRWNFMDWRPQWDTASLINLIIIFAILIFFWFLSKNTHLRGFQLISSEQDSVKASLVKATHITVRSAISGLICLALVGIAVAIFFTPETLREGFFGRTTLTPLWYRGCQSFLLCLPSVFWLLNVWRRSTNKNVT